MNVSFSLGLVLAAMAVVCLGPGCERTRPVDEATQAGILLVGLGPEPERLDPQLTTSVAAFNVIFALFEGLVAPHPETLTPEPGVAQRWAVSEDGLVYTFELNPEARWSNGEAVVASDFVFAWRRLLSPDLGAPYGTLLHAIEGAEAYHRGELEDFSEVGVDAVSANELRIQLHAPVPYFLQLLMHPATFPLFEGSVRTAGAITDRSAQWAVPSSLIGNGPFSLTAWTPNRVIEVQKNTYYWDAERVSLQGIRFYPITDLGAEERAFQAGQLHLTEALPPMRVRHYRERDPEVLRIDPYLGTYYYLFNHDRPPLDDVRVRQALSLTIDREAIAQAILGAGQEAARSFTPPGIAHYTPPTMLTENPELARGLLAEAGFPEGEGFPILELLINTSESHQRIAEAIQDMWKKSLGIDIRLRNVEFGVYLDLRESGDFDIARAAWIGDYLDPHSFLSLWKGANPNNFSRWSDPAYDALIERSDALRNPDERRAILAEAEAILMRQQVISPIYSYVTVYLKRPEVAGWHSNLLDWHPYKYVRLIPVEN